MRGRQEVGGNFLVLMRKFPLVGGWEESADLAEDLSEAWQINEDGFGCLRRKEYFCAEKKLRRYANNSVWGMKIERNIYLGRLVRSMHNEYQHGASCYTFSSKSACCHTTLVVWCPDLFAYYRFKYNADLLCKEKATDIHPLTSNADLLCKEKSSIKRDIRYILC